MTPKRNLLIAFMFFIALQLFAATPIEGLLERIDKGASRKIMTETVRSDRDFFEITSKNGKPLIRGNNYVSIASGINWYLKYSVGVHLTWNSMHASLPATLPLVQGVERHTTDIKHRYYLNYCTLSYSMAFWDWKRWEQELDWMALHGINLCLDIVGTDVVWRNVLLKLGYTKDEANEFVAGPAFQAWWLMNNLEGWGGPNSDNWYQQRERLQKQIMKRMKELGINVCLPGYSGMVPYDAKQRLGLDVADPGKWNDYKRPAFLQPTSKRFAEIASIYYKEQQRLYGKADFYSMDPFHEGGNAGGVDLRKAGEAIMGAMKAVNPNAVWVVQAWGACPYPSMIKHLKNGDMLVLDLYSENRPQWGNSESTWYRKEGFNGHDWAFCMLLNFGGNVGMFGKLQHVVDEYYKARCSSFKSTMKGVGLTMEGIENNPVMYELVSELPWRDAKFSWKEWLHDYVEARYGNINNAKVHDAWLLLARSVYGAGAKIVEQGCHESVLCARPALDVYQVSSWSEMEEFYNPDDVINAARLMVEASHEVKANDNFRYDLVDVTRQAIAEQARYVYDEVVAAYKAKDRKMFDYTTKRFLDILLQQDRMLSSMPDFMVGGWIRSARNLGTNAQESDHYEWNARVQITTWGNRNAAEKGGLREYAHKEWNGVLADFYYPRWKAYFEALAATFDGKPMKNIDFYAMDEAWTLKHNAYPYEAQGNPVEFAQTAFNNVFGK
ncbi:alpha-N-acetylglucosaminidase [Prevotella sp.]|uniref:alpha-N-acetylglucosaminidase n=2 Tax=Prevotella sp. TaxID=59823 RepID=UPI0025F47F72|nr:alpha-N-acetylglucosaminidase [Prevotella sp.]MCI6129848.1 alpha-N-acetylglucosaminidase [Prevotella sp.]